jgi:hypothetical protein
MNKGQTVNRVLIICFGCIAAGLVLWPVPYQDLAILTRGFLLQWVAGAAIAGCIGRFLMRQSLPMTALFIACGFGLATIGRVIFELIKDPTSHNLWPFEVATAIAVGGAAGLVGASLAALAWKAKTVS